MITGPAPLAAFPCETGPSHFGLSFIKGSRWAKEKEPVVVLGLVCRGLTLPLAEGRAQLGVSRLYNLFGLRLLGAPDHSIFSFWVHEGLQRPSAKEQLLEKSSKINCALMEEASRYENASNPCGTLVCDFSSLPFSFSGRTPLVLRPFWGQIEKIPERMTGPYG